jgi:hypothetical protein
VQPVRTTITLTPEVEALVKKAMAERKMSFKEIVNEAIRRGLGGASTGTKLELPTFEMGPPKISLDQATQLAAVLEDEEILRKMSIGR